MRRTAAGTGTRQRTLALSSALLCSVLGCGGSAPSSTADSSAVAAPSAPAAPRPAPPTPLPIDATQAAALRSAAASLAAAADGGAVVTGRDGWLFLTKELVAAAAGRFWGVDAPDPESDPLAAIVDFHRQLQGAGIELVLLPVPTKAHIYPDRLPGNPLGIAKGGAVPRLDQVLAQLYAELAERGVTVLDLTDELLTMRATGDSTAPLHLMGDSHWAGPAIELAARRVAERYRDRDWARTAATLELATERRQIEIDGDLRRSLPDGPRPPTERVTLTLVGTRAADGRLEPVKPDRSSPVLLLGDSHNLVFHAGAELHARGAGLPDHLAREFGFAIDLVAVRGSGATPARVSLLRRRDNLAGKRLVVWCLTARELATSSWKRVPVIRP